MQPQWEKKSRFLTQLLIWSGAINIGLLSSLSYFVFKKRPEIMPFELQPVGSSKVVRISNQEILTAFSTCSWAELVSHLESVDPVEAGYKKRDLALSSLASFHGFDIEKALQGSFVQKRLVTFGRKEGPEEMTITLYPGLTEDQFQAIRYFIQTEKFPFTARGLFYEIQHTTAPRDPSLLQAFYLTDEFHAVLTLCQRTGVHLPSEFLIEMIAQGDWKILHQFAEEQKQALDLSPDRLKKLLLGYTQHRSVFAAKILLQWDREFLLKRLEDRDLIAFLDLFKDASPLLESLLKELITSPRSDAVWKKAAERLYLFAQQPFPNPYDHRLTLQMFAGAHPLPTPQLAAASKEVRHTIQTGENLWKIARKYKVSIEAIRQANHLESDKLREGKTLIIPARQPTEKETP
jgi:hypothetical protein